MYKCRLVDCPPIVLGDECQSDPSVNVCLPLDE